MTRLIALSSILLVSMPLYASSIPDKLKNQYIIQFDNTIPKEKRSEITQQIINKKGQIKHQYHNAIKGMSITLPPQALQALKKRFPEIIHVEENITVALVAKKERPNKKPDNNDSTPVRSIEIIPWGVAYVGGGGKSLNMAPHGLLIQVLIADTRI